MMKLTKPELKLLKEIAQLDGMYPAHWSAKDREKLVTKGLTQVSGHHIAITEAGLSALKEHDPQAVSALANRPVVRMINPDDPDELLRRAINEINEAKAAGAKASKSGPGM